MNKGKAPFKKNAEEVRRMNQTHLFFKLLPWPTNLKNQLYFNFSTNLYVLYTRKVSGEDFSPSSGSLLIWSITIQYNGTLDEIRVITCWVKKIVIDQINKLPEDGLKSSPETLRYIENTWISRKSKIKLYFSHTLLMF